MLTFLTFGRKRFGESNLLCIQYFEDCELDKVRRIWATAEANYGDMFEFQLKHVDDKIDEPESPAESDEIEVMDLDEIVEDKKGGEDIVDSDNE